MRLLLDRQALHARRLKIRHPLSGEPLEFVAPLPADIEAVLRALRNCTAIRRSIGANAAYRTSGLRGSSLGVWPNRKCTRSRVPSVRVLANSSPAS